MLFNAFVESVMHLFELKVFTVTFDYLNVSLLNKIIKIIGLKVVTLPGLIWRDKYDLKAFKNMILTIQRQFAAYNDRLWACGYLISSLSFSPHWALKL